MNQINIINQSAELNTPIPKIKKFLRTLLKIRGKKNWEISILFCDEDYMAELNFQYRQKDGATDVLSFCQSDGDQIPQTSDMVEAGDIVICPSFMKKNCIEFNVSEEEELKRLLIHGLLHLEGFDHITNDAVEPMLMLQEKILSENNKELLF